MLPAELLRGAAPRLPEVSEPDLVRHYVRLSELNFSIDTGFYPLGSCTMKHNPKINERVAALPGFAHLHPLQEDEAAQGTLEVLWRLQGFLSSIAGLPHVTLQPAAGAQGELCGLLLMRAYHESRNDPRRTVVIPDTAHGTNPASVTMAGYDTVKVKTDARGGVDLDDLRSKVDENVAGLMLTNPSTTGLFDENIAEIAKVFHDVGALLYYDGANLNAVMGVSRPGDMGFDIVHFNTHKSFSTPHGGGGPGAGPVAVTEALERFLPKPVLRRRDDGTLWLEGDRPDSIGKLKSYVGNTGVLVRAYTYIRSNGADGIRDAAETAVLNANYLLARLKHAYDLPVRPAVQARVRAVGAQAEARARREGAGRGQAADGLRVPPADDLLPAAGARGADDRADRDREQGDARRVRRRDAADREGGRRAARARPGGPARDPGQAARRGARREEPGGAAGAGRALAGLVSP